MLANGAIIIFVATRSLSIRTKRTNDDRERKGEKVEMGSIGLGFYPVKRERVVRDDRYKRIVEAAGWFLGNP